MAYSVIHESGSWGGGTVTIDVPSNENWLLKSLTVANFGGQNNTTLTVSVNGLAIAYISTLDTNGSVSWPASGGNGMVYGATAPVPGIPAILWGGSSIAMTIGGTTGTLNYVLTAVTL